MLEALEAWQTAPDSPEALRCLPRLTRKDADCPLFWVPTEESEREGVPVWTHRLACNGVVHLKVYFRLTDLSLEQLTAVSFLAGLLGNLRTRNHDALKLQHAIRRTTGYFGVNIITSSAGRETETCTPYLVCLAGALKENADAAAELISEVLTSTCFDEEEKILEMAQQVKLSVQQRVVSSGQTIALRHVLARYSANGAVKYALDGVPALRYIRDFADHPEVRLPEFRELGERIREQTCCRARMRISVTAEQGWDPLPLLRAIPEGTPAPDAAAYRVDLPEKAGFRIPGQVGFMARGYRLSRCAQPFSGAKWLTTGILTLDYLWNRIRVRGGAYGAGMQMDRAGTVYTYSFRDPAPGKSLEADAGAAAFLRRFAGREEDLDRYIISALNENNPLLGPREQASVADARLMSGAGREELERIRLQILNATMQEILESTEWLEAYAKEGAVCVVAPQKLLEACGLPVTEEL